MCGFLFPVLFSHLSFRDLVVPDVVVVVSNAEVFLLLAESGLDGLELVLARGLPSNAATEESATVPLTTPELDWTAGDVGAVLPSDAPTLSPSERETP